jgi:xanthine dehydrogenase accessory factor
MTDADIYKEIIRIREADEEAALVTIVSTAGSTPREEGAKMLVRADGSILGSIGGGGLEARVCELAAKVMRKGKPERFKLSLTEEEGRGMGMICGGDMEVFIEPVLSPPTLYLFGGGHMSLPVARIARLLNLRIPSSSRTSIRSSPDWISSKRTLSWLSPASTATTRWCWSRP